MQSNKRTLLILLGLIVFVLLLLLPVPGGFERKSWYMISLVVLIAFWWITEPIPLAITALIPIVALPMMQIVPLQSVTLSYANEAIFLFLGGFMFAIAMERSRLHYRFALHVIKMMGSSPSQLILGFMIATYVLSMWVSNTATVLMMIPVALAITNGVITVSEKRSKVECNFTKALLLSIAYSASIGGVATLIGTPPNIIMASVLSRVDGVHISFAQWMMYGVPVTFIFLLLSWVILVKVLFSFSGYKLPVDKEGITKQIKELGKMTDYEKRIGVLFGLVALSWIFRGLIKIPFFETGINDTSIALAGALFLFIIPSGRNTDDRLLNWDDTIKKLPWDILLLFGGGLALSSGVNDSGLNTVIADCFIALEGIDLWLLLLVVVSITLLLTELMSNTAAVTLLLPIVINVAIAMNVNPLLLAIPVTVASSFAFMFPVSTPPNAIVFSYKYVTIREMALTGMLLNILGVFVISFTAEYLIPLIF